MPSKPRSAIFDRDEVGVYHCWNRLVQRRHLFGFDCLSGKDYSYRKPWVRGRLRELAAAMAIDILDYAVLDNHLRVVLRNRPDIVAGWSDEEVVRRWWRVCPLRRNADRSVPEPLPCEIGLLLEKVEEYRRRLSDISWLMRLACQTIAVRANREDDMDGRFFAKRFECRRLQTEAELLTCSLYVDLNVIRAGKADTPESSEFTSVFDRIRTRWQSVRDELQTNVPLDIAADDWLAPVCLNECSKLDSNAQPGAKHPRCNPIGSARLSDKGFLPMTLDQYLGFVDTIGRMIRRGQRGQIPADLPPILQRLGLDPTAWFDWLVDLFRGPSDVVKTPNFTSSV